jgi:hypothetical protein
MWDLLALVPVGLAMGLLAFGRYGGRENEPSRRAVVIVGIAAILAGPVAIEVLGFAQWLIAVATATGALTVYAVSRNGPRPAA